MKHIPALLLYTRPFLTAIIIASAVIPNLVDRLAILVLITVCIVADILDGIIARHLQISNLKFRLLDTFFDLMFYLATVVYVWSVNPSAIDENINVIKVILLLECLLYSISIIRFGKLPSPHAVLSKSWGLLLAIEFFLLILNVEGNHFTIALWFGVLVHVDRVLIYVFIRQWDHDIPSCYHAWQLRQGKSIVRHKLLNG